MAWLHPDRILTLDPPGKDHLQAFQKEALRHLVVDFVDDDMMVSAYVQAGIDAVEKYIQCALPQRACKLRLPCLPAGMLSVELPGGVVSNVTLKVDGVVSAASFEVIGSAPARAVPAGEWPVALGTGYPVEWSYLAGYAPGLVPVPLRMAALIIAKSIYDNRGDMEEGPADLPPSAISLMRPWRIRPIR